MLDYSVMRNFLLDLASQIIQAKDELNSMDAACGDGDFGTGMYLAFKKVPQAIEKQKEEDIGILLTSVGDVVLSSAGGASGPLFGTLFIEAGKSAIGKSDLSLADLAAMFDQSAQKIRTRGGAKVGDKTLVDALEPAVNSLKESVTADVPLPRAIKKAADAAKTGCESTKRLIAKRGKAKYLGEQTLGFADPGAYAITFVFNSLAASIEGRQLQA